MTLFFDRIVSKSREKRIPLVVHLLLTEECNLRCVHCYLSRRKRPELSLGQYEDLFETLKKSGTFILVLSGGEPLLRPDFFPIAKAARRRSFALRIFTNGQQVDEETAKKIAGLYPLSVDISLYGSNSKTHDQVTRVLGSFDKACRAIKLLACLGLRVQVKTPLMSCNFSEIEDIRTLTESLGAALHESPYLYPPHGNGKRQKELSLNVDQLKALRTSRDSADENAVESPNKRQACGAARCLAAIGSDGSVFPCPMFKEAAGNLFQQTFDQIWQKAPFFQRLRDLRFDDLESCRECGLSQNCLRCVASVHNRTGRLDAVDPEACRIATACACEETITIDALKSRENHAEETQIG
jgi:AdoMet-dependent heme synthase